MNTEQYRNQERTSNQRVHDKLLGVRNMLDWNKVGGLLYSAPMIVHDLTFYMAIAAQDGKLTEEQCEHILGTPRSDLLCEYLSEARNELAQNREQYGGMTWLQSFSLVEPYHFSSSKRDKQHNLDNNISRLTREQLCQKYGIEEWRSNKTKYVNDVLYARFLNENGLSDMPGAEVTEADLEPVSGNDVFSRRESWMGTVKL